MKKIIKKLKAEKINTREVIYLLNRLLKQAQIADEYIKNVFDDYVSIESRDEIISKAREYYNKIEKYECKNAKHFDINTYVKWVDALNEVDASLDSEPSDDIKQNVQKFLENM